MKMLRLIRPIGRPPSITGRLIRSRRSVNSSSTAKLAVSDRTEIVSTHRSAATDRRKRGKCKREALNSTGGNLYQHGDLHASWQLLRPHYMLIKRKYCCMCCSTVMVASYSVCRLVRIRAESAFSLG